MTTIAIIESILAEKHRAEAARPAWLRDIVHAVAIMNEEAGEAVQAANTYVYDGGDIEDVRKEVIQTAAMCIRVLENMHRYERRRGY